jgi:hypothetical protein
MAGCHANAINPISAVITFLKVTKSGESRDALRVKQESFLALLEEYRLFNQWFFLAQLCNGGTL